MGCLMVDNFLFCFTLRSGILFVASTTIVSHIFMLLCVAFSADYMVFLKYVGLHHYANAMMIVCVVLGILTVVVNVVLVIGVLYKHGVLLLIWLIICGLYITCLVALMLASTIIVALTFPFLPATATGIFFCYFFALCWVFYIFCVVYTYYRKMEMEVKSIHPLHKRDRTPSSRNSIRHMHCAE